MKKIFFRQLLEESFLLRDASSIEYNKDEFDIVINNAKEDILRRVKI